MSRSQSETGNGLWEALPPLLAAKPQSGAFSARGWKQGSFIYLKIAVI
ncbi:MAG: hypothetical protein V7K50_16575 [Nostoc sp.]